MKKHLPLLTIVIFLMLGNIVRGDCPEDPNDHGECDTMYVEPWPDDIFLQDDPPYFVRVPIYVTCDVVDGLDSISGFAIPLCYSHSNPSKYCSVSAYWNNTNLYPYPNLDRSIFRHFIEGTDTTIHNRMMDLAADFSGREWDTRIVDMKSDSSWCYYYPEDTTLDSAFVPPHFWLSLVPLGTQDQRWWEGSRILLATMTFKLEDTMTICLDTCWWPPKSHLAWSNRAASVKIPRPGTGDSSSFEVCFFRGPSDVREIQGSEDSRPSQFSLSQNYPNPFNPVTNFRFSLSKSAYVKIDIFNIVGQKVRTLVDEEMKPGVYVADWDGKDEKGNFVSSGIYFYRMQAGDFSDMKKMVLVK
ncbi:MAG: T9SS type A sorting domain-containing protein [candidate division Zixibacteria bacterium]|nr:T9SS type A sorting domain-containing protein [candidate division Zixibacteria bacterium]